MAGYLEQIHASMDIIGILENFSRYVIMQDKETSYVPEKGAGIPIFLNRHRLKKAPTFKFDDLGRVFIF